MKRYTIMENQAVAVGLSAQREHKPLRWHFHKRGVLLRNNLSQTAATAYLQGHRDAIRYIVCANCLKTLAACTCRDSERAMAEAEIARAFGELNK